MAIINPLSTKNAQIDIKSGTGGINLGTDATAKDITIFLPLLLTLANLPIGLYPH